MSSTDHGHDVTAPITDRLHENSWSANLEGPEHAVNRSLVVAQAIDAIEHTARGYHVNLVTHGEHGHPENYLYEALEAHDFGDRSISYDYVNQCGCGGHVTKVRVG